MKVFLSWSGDISKKMALVLKEWLPLVIPIDPYVSAKDIQAGARWQQDIAKELQDTDFGISCVTPQNTDAPWIQFEAGALSKSVDQSRVCPLLFGLSNKDLSSENPLLQFQTKTLDKNGIYELLQGINDATSEPTSEEVLHKRFASFWPELEQKIKPLIKELKQEATQTHPKESPPPTSQDLMIGEILELVRSQQKLLSQSTPSQLPGAQIRDYDTVSNFINNCIEVYKEEGIQSVPVETLERMVEQIDRVKNSPGVRRLLRSVFEHKETKTADSQ